MSQYPSRTVYGDEIRLLRVLPASSSDPSEPLCCELRVVALPRARQEKYVALSYTWGPPTAEAAAGGMTAAPDQAILVNGYALPVTANLLSGLRRLRAHAEYSAREFWIDAVCINQTDEAERRVQVQCMAQIYSSAASVVVWLGEAEEEEEDNDDDDDDGPTTTAAALALIRRLAPLSADDWRRLRPDTLASCGELLGSERYVDVARWAAIATLLHRRYFTRLWIIQEVTLAREATVLCGRHSLPWDSIELVSHRLSVTAWKSYLQRMVMTPSAPTSGATNVAHGGGSTTKAAAYLSMPTIMRAIRKPKETTEAERLLHTLIRARRFEAADPRDKVYGLLGIVSSSSFPRSAFSMPVVAATEPPPVSSPEDARLRPIYGTRTAREVYVDAALHILETGDELLLLSCAEGSLFRTEAVAGPKTAAAGPSVAAAAGRGGGGVTVYPPLPSWVPDWSCTAHVGLGVTGYQR